MVDGFLVSFLRFQNCSRIAFSRRNIFITTVYIELSERFDLPSRREALLS